MESIENPASRTLRNMRFALEANTTLDEQLALQLTEQSRNLASFAFYASQQVLLTMEEYYENQGQLHEIGKRFTSFHEPFHLRPIVRSKQIDGQTTRIVFAPVEQALFDAAVSLDPVQRRGQNSWDVHPVPNRVKEQKDRGHYVFVDVPSSSLLGPSQREMATRTMIGKLTMGQLWVHGDAFVKVRDGAIDQKPTGSVEHDAASGDDTLEQVG